MHGLQLICKLSMGHIQGLVDMQDQWPFLVDLVGEDDYICSVCINLIKKLE